MQQDDISALTDDEGLAIDDDSGDNGVKQVASPFVRHEGSAPKLPPILKSGGDMPEWSNFDCDERLPVFGAQTIPAKSLYAFCAESHAIEGVFDSALTEELAARTADFLDTELSLDSLSSFNIKGHLRSQYGMALRVGPYVAPAGGPPVRVALRNLLTGIAQHETSSYDAHCEFMALLPFTDGNGLTGRALWLYHRLLADEGVPHKFLRNWYVSSLSHWRNRLG